MTTIQNHVAGEYRPRRLRCTDCDKKSLKRAKNVTVNNGTALITYRCTSCDGQTHPRSQKVTSTDDGYDWTFNGVTNTRTREDDTERPTFRTGTELVDERYIPANGGEKVRIDTDADDHRGTIIGWVAHVTDNYAMIQLPDGYDGCESSEMLFDKYNGDQAFFYGRDALSVTDVEVLD